MRKKYYPHGIGVSSLLMLFALPAVLYLEYRGTVHFSGTSWIWITMLICYTIGFIVMNAVRAALFRRWQDHSRATDAARRIDLTVLGVTMLLGLLLSAVFRALLNRSIANHL